MPDYQLLFPSEFLRAVDMQGKDATVTIEAVDLRDLPLRGTSQTKRKGVVTMKESRKDGTVIRVVLNRTNADTIASLYGNDTDAWLGQRVTLFPTRVKFGREEVDAIRVRPTKPNGQRKRSSGRKQAAPPPADDWGPVDDAGEAEAEAHHSQYDE